MVVDDNPSNLNILEEMLTQQGYGVRAFPLGRLALAAARKDPPSLILLDINMPEMNGYEVCAQLQSSPDLREIPVIFLSALNDVEDKVRAFRAGGVDYISKPFEFEEIRARVETHLKVHGLQQELRLQNEHLEELVSVRTRELSDANDRLTILDRSKSEFLQLISHEFRTPLNGILGVGQLILESMPATPENEELQELFRTSRLRILSILEDALLLTEIDVSKVRFTPGPVSLDFALDRAVKQTLEFAQESRVGIIYHPTDLGLVVGHEELLIRALHRLLKVAVQFCVPDEGVLVTAQTLPGSIEVTIDSQGKRLPPQEASKFFDILSVGEANTPAGHLGLAPAVSYRILSLFGASVSVENREEPLGIRITISFTPVT